VNPLSAEPVALWAAALTASAIAAVAWQLKSLTAPGAVAATLVGVAVLSGTGWGGAIVLGTYFITSIAASRAFPWGSSRPHSRTAAAPPGKSRPTGAPPQWAD